MSRVVLIADSETGRLIDVAGNGREGGRYKRFAKRMMSTDANPTLDYGANGGDTLTVSKGTGRGKAINLLADSVNIYGSLKVNGEPVGPDDSSRSVLDDIMGTEGEVSVSDVTITNQETGEVRSGLQISLDATVLGKIRMIESAIDDISGFVSKDDIADVIKNLMVAEGDTLEDVKGTLSTLLSRLATLAGVEQASSPSSGSSSASSSSHS